MDLNIHLVRLYLCIVYFDGNVAGRFYMVVCYFFKFVCIDCKAGICDLFGAAFAAKDPLARISEVKIA